MPLYDYECRGTPDEPCTHDWEESQRIADPHVTHCPACRQPTAVRVIRATGGFALKGPGWARDGYATTARTK